MSDYAPPVEGVNTPPTAPLTAAQRSALESELLEFVREWTQIDGRLVLSRRELGDFRDQLTDVIWGRES